LHSLRGACRTIYTFYTPGINEKSARPASAPLAVGKSWLALVVRLANYTLAVSRGAGKVTDDDASVSGLLTVLRISRVMDRIDAGVSPQQYRMLKLIGAGGERSARLAEKLAVAKPTLTSTADSLVAAGLAVREAEPGDRRVVRLRLTPAGVAAVTKADAAYGEWFDGLLDQTGRRDDILGGLQALEATMTERWRARHAADPSPAATTPAATTPAATTPAAATPAAAAPAAATPAAADRAGQL
jgi:DNA-binding MarR family transcriptional regulator